MAVVGDHRESFAVADGVPPAAPAVAHASPAQGGRCAAAPLQVHLVAPPLVCWGLQRLVQTAGPRFQLAGVSSRLEDALPAMERDLPDVVVLDFDDGYGVEDLRDAYLASRAKLLVVTSAADPDFLSLLFDAGACGVLQKREGPGALLKAIDAVGTGALFAAPAAARDKEPQPRATPRRHDVDAERIASLTTRERQTVAAVTSDASAPVKVIAGRLCISEHTLRNHLTSIYSKLGVTGRLALHAYADRHALKAPVARLAPFAR
ncbi:MAG TPA: response regulator transcription factor [Ramlibacter sp.]